jgi:hypothetical protein
MDRSLGGLGCIALFLLPFAGTGVFAAFQSTRAVMSGTCGKTPVGVGFCWGDNFAGELGDGTTLQRLQPRAVAPPGL